MGYFTDTYHKVIDFFASKPQVTANKTDPKLEELQQQLKPYILSPDKPDLEKIDQLIAKFAGYDPTTDPTIKYDDEVFAAQVAKIPPEKRKVLQDISKFTADQLISREQNDIAKALRKHMPNPLKLEGITNSVGLLKEIWRENSIIIVPRFHPTQTFGQEYLIQNMQALKEAGLTHISLELPKTLQSNIDKYAKTGDDADKFYEFKMGGKRSNESFYALIKTANEHGVKVLANDSAYNFVEFNINDNKQIITNWKTRFARSSYEVSQTLKDLTKDGGNKVLSLEGWGHVMEIPEMKEDGVPRGITADLCGAVTVEFLSRKTSDPEYRRSKDKSEADFVIGITGDNGALSAYKNYCLKKADKNDYVTVAKYFTEIGQPEEAGNVLNEMKSKEAVVVDPKDLRKPSGTASITITP